VVYFILTLSMLLGQFAHANTCTSKVQITKKVMSSSERVYSISSSNAECFESKNKFNQAIYTQFKKTISEKTNTDPVYLIEIQKVIFAEKLPAAVPIFDLILNGSIGSIRDISVLEAFLMTEHLSLNGRKGEFAALILRAKDGAQKIYFTSGSEASASFSKKVYEKLANDLSEGYIFYGHLHNHPFNFDNPHGDIAGTTVPSPWDRKIYNDFKIVYGLKNAFVTNGFSTIAIPDSQFELLPKD